MPFLIHRLVLIGRSRGGSAAYLGLRVVLGVLLFGAMVFATRFGWFSPRFQQPQGLRLAIVLTAVVLLTALAATFRRFTFVELAVSLATFFVIGMLLFPALNGHTGEPSTRDLIW